MKILISLIFLILISVVLLYVFQLRRMAINNFALMAPNETIININYKITFTTGFEIRCWGTTAAVISCWPNVTSCLLLRQPLVSAIGPDT